MSKFVVTEEKTCPKIGTEFFFQHFATFASAPDGIPRLRELILQLAIQGKLGTQDPRDEPANVLMKKIKRERNLSEKVPKTKREHNIEPINKDEEPFAIPKNWEWLTLGSLGSTQTGTTPLKGDYASYGNDYPFIKPADIFSNSVNYQNEGLSKEGVEKYGRVAPKNSILMVCIGTIGKCNVIFQECSFNQQINSITPYSPINSILLLYFMRSSYFQSEGWRRSSSTTISILNKGKWTLRQTILQLAVQGRLVRQEPGDEPAEKLLERITKEKERLVNEGKIRKQPHLSNFSDEDQSYSLPQGWIWAHLNDVYDVRDGTHDTPKYHSHGIPFLTSKNLSSGSLDFTNITLISEEDHKKFSQRSKVDRNDILIAMVGSIGNPVIVDTDKEFSVKNVALFKYYCLNLSSPKFLYYFLRLATQKMKEKTSFGVQSFVSLKYLREYPIPLPPLAEQHRIVAKVNALMALCDELEARLKERAAVQGCFAGSIVKNIAGNVQ